MYKMNPLKKIVGISLLFIFLFNIIAFYPIFFLVQYGLKETIKQKLKQSIPESELTVISVKEGDGKSIEWLDRKEFRYRDNLYDIVKKKVDKDGTIHFYCINDSKEKKLFAGLDKQLQNDMGTTGKNSKDSAKGFIKDYFFTPSLFSFQQPFSDFLFPKYDGHYLSVDEDIVSPPPELA